MLGSFLAGRKNAGIDPGGREKYRNRSWRAGRTWFRISRDMVSSISISEKGEEGFKVCSEEPGGREECWDRSWSAGKMLGSILMGGKNAGIDPGGREEGRMPGSILTGGKNAGIDPGGREECWNRSWRAGKIPESILAGGKNMV